VTGDINHIYGRTRFGDNIEDEWFIVFLLFELSKAFPELLIRLCEWCDIEQTLQSPILIRIRFIVLVLWMSTGSSYLLRQQIICLVGCVLKTVIIEYESHFFDVFKSQY
jgi:hypothetical protein